MPEPLTVAGYIAGQLAAWGVTSVFGVPGDSFLPLLEAIRENAQVTFHVCRHEETAAFMASAQAKLTGKLGVCLADGGPGAVHLLNGILDAAFDGVPVLALTGQVAREWLGTAHVQAYDPSAVFGRATGLTTTIVSPAQAARVLGRAVRTALSERTAVHLALAKDVGSQPAASAVSAREPVPMSRPRIQEAELDRAARVLAAARRPAILAGRGIRGSGDKVLKLAEVLGAAVVNTLPAKGAMPETRAPVLGCLGLAGNAAARETLGQADTVLILASTWWPTGFVPSGAKVVQVDLKPERIGAGPEVEVGLVGEAAEVSEALLARLGRSEPSPEAGEWPRKVEEAVARRDRWIEESSRPDGVPVHPAHLIRTLEEKLPSDAIVALDTGDHTLWFGAHFRASRQDVLLSGRWRTMGWGFPAAMAASLALPSRRVYCLTGDGGLGMVLADLATAARYHLPVTVVVANNGAYALEAHKQAREGYPSYGQEFLNPDFAAIAGSLGGTGKRVEKPGDLGSYLDEAAKAQNLYLIDVPTRRVPPPEEGGR